MKTVFLEGRDPVRSKIVISNKNNNNNIGHVNTLNYLGCSISYQNENNITLQISKCLQVTEIFNRTLKPYFVIWTQNLDN